MMEWFMSGGFGMFTVLPIGVGSIGYGVKAIHHVSPKRLAVLRALPELVFTTALFTFGTNLWAVYRYLESHAPKPGAPANAQLAVVGLIGFTETAQVLTLAELLA